MACQIHFWDAFINRQIDDVIVMTHNYEVKFRKSWKVTFNIQTWNLTDILILCPKIKFQKNLDFSMKFPYGLCILNRIHGMSGILKAFSKVSGQILDAAGLNFGQDLRDMNVSPGLTKSVSLMSEKVTQKMWNVF